MFKNLWTTVSSWFSNDVVEEYNFKSMSLKRGKGSNFWTPEKESKMLELFSKNYSYEEVGRAIGATNGQLATKVRSLRQKGITINGTNKVKTNVPKLPKKNKKQVKEIVSEVIKELK